MFPRSRQPVAEATVARYWRLSLALGGAVIVVVAALLTALARTAEQIESTCAEIWRVGKLIAGNTVHVPLLVRTNQIATDILRTAGGIERATARIERAVVGNDGRE